MATSTPDTKTSGAKTPKPTPRSRNKRGEGDLLRRDLIAEAARQLAEHGSVEAVSLRKVATAVGVSPTSVYRHFEDHNALLGAAVSHAWFEFAELMANAQADGETAYDRLRSCGQAYARFAQEEPGRYQVLFSNNISVPGFTLGDPSPPKTDAGNAAPAEPQETLDHAKAGSPDAYSQEAFTMLVDIVGAVLTENGDDRDPFYVAIQVHTWLHGIVDLHHCHGEFPWPPMEQMLDDLAEALRLTPQS